MLTFEFSHVYILYNYNIILCFVLLQTANGEFEVADQMVDVKGMLDV